MYRNALDPYGLSYEPNLGWDSPEVTSTANALFAAQPSRFPRWELNALAGGEQAKAGLFGKALGALGLDESGNRAATSWIDAAKHTAGNVINAPQDIANQLLALREYQPVYGTVGDAEDRALAGRQAAETFGLAGLAPIAGAGLTRATRPAVWREMPTAPPPARAELPSRAAFEYQGQTFEGPIHGSAISLAEDRFGQALWDDWKQPNGWQTAREGYVTNTGRFVTRKEADDLLRESGLLAHERTVPSEMFALHSSELNNLKASRPELFTPGVTRATRPAIAREVVSEVATPTDATPGLVVQGYRGHSAEHGIGPRPGKPQAVFATPDEFMANAFAQKGGTVSPVEMRFSNPYVVDAEGAQFWRVPLAERDGLLGRMLGPKRGNMDELTRRKQAEGHDGIVAKNVEEVGYDGTSRLADQYVALQRGTVFDPATGNLLWSNPKEASLPALMSQSREGQGEIIDIIRKYGWAAAAPLIAAYQTDGAQASNALAGR